MSPRCVLKSAILLFGLLAITMGLIFLRLRRSEAQARELVQALASLSLGTSTAVDVHSIEQRFRSYRIVDKQANDLRLVSFAITNQRMAKLRLMPFAQLQAAVGIRDAKVVSVEVTLQRQVGRSSDLAAIIFESSHHSLFCDQPYCVGNPIGKPFIACHLDSRATPEQKRRAFNLNLGWLTRLHGKPRICDLSPDVWEDWKSQAPNSAADLRSTYHCD